MLIPLSVFQHHALQHLSPEDIANLASTSHDMNQEYQNRVLPAIEHRLLHEYKIDTRNTDIDPKKLYGFLRAAEIVTKKSKYSRYPKCVHTLVKPVFVCTPSTDNDVQVNTCKLMMLLASNNLLCSTTPLMRGAILAAVFQYLTNLRQCPNNIMLQHSRLRTVILHKAWDIQMMRSKLPEVVRHDIERACMNVVVYALGIPCQQGNVLPPPPPPVGL